MPAERLELFNLSPERIRAQSSIWPGFTLSTGLAEQAARTPDAVALEDGDRQLTYEQFHQSVRRIAAGLRRRGVTPGSVVTYQIPTSFDTILLHYAIAYAGAVASPVSLLHREHDLRSMLALARPSLMVTCAEHRGVAHARIARESLRQAGLDVPVLMTSAGQLEQEIGEVPDGGLRPDAGSPDDALFVCWTSGTTGEPKGVVHTHNTGMCGVTTKLEHMGISAGDGMLIMTPTAHAVGIYGMHMLAVGVRIVLMETWEPERAVRLIEQTRPTLSFAPSTFLMDLVRTESLAHHDVSSLRVFSCGGAPIPGLLIELADERMPACHVLSSYGTSEEGSVTAARPSDPRELSAVSDGVPLRDVELRTLGPDGRDVDIGQDGDLVVRCPNAFAGYLRRADLTREAVDADGWRWTGDRAVLRPDGTIRITGRTKDIIIRGGLNVPIVQVEGVLVRHPSIAKVAIVGMPDARLGERACAYVVPERGERPVLDELREFLTAQGVAKTYWPERLELVDELPMTASGKVQKFRLREMIAERLEAER